MAATGAPEESPRSRDVRRVGIKPVLTVMTHTQRERERGVLWLSVPHHQAICQETESGRQGAGQRHTHTGSRSKQRSFCFLVGGEGGGQSGDRNKPLVCTQFQALAICLEDAQVVQFAQLLLSSVFLSFYSSSSFCFSDLAFLQF